MPYASLADAADLRAAASDEEVADGDDSGSVARVGDGGAVPGDASGGGSAGSSTQTTPSPEVESEDESSKPDDSDAAAETGDPSSADGASESEPTSTDDADPGSTLDADAASAVEPDAGSSEGPDTELAEEPNTESVEESDTESAAETEPDESDDERGDATDDEPDEPRSMAAHVDEVVDGATGRARLLDDGFEVLDEVDAGEAFDAVEGAETAPHAVVVDGTVDQRLLDVAAQRGGADVDGRELGEVVKRPAGTRVLAAADVWAGN